MSYISCQKDSSPSGTSGVFDKSNDLNDYKDYTIVQGTLSIIV